MSSVLMRNKRNLYDLEGDKWRNDKRQIICSGKFKNINDNFKNYEEIFSGDKESNSYKILKKLQVLCPKTELKEIQKLLKQNKDDLISVMNILKEKNEKEERESTKRKTRKSHKNVSALRARIREKFLKIKMSRENEISETSINHAQFKNEDSTNYSNNSSKSEEIRSESNDVQKITRKETSRDWQGLINKILSCRREEEVKEIIQNLATECDKDKNQADRLRAENYILKMGILQRKELTAQDIRKRIELEAREKNLECENFRLRHNQAQMESNIGSMWHMSQFGRRPGL